MREYTEELLKILRLLIAVILFSATGELYDSKATSDGRTLERSYQPLRYARACLDMWVSNVQRFVEIQTGSRAPFATA
jgi:hypothetical protein